MYKLLMLMIALFTVFVLSVGYSYKNYVETLFEKRVQSTAKIVYPDPDKNSLEEFLAGQ